MLITGNPGRLSCQQQSPLTPAQRFGRFVDPYDREQYEPPSPQKKAEYVLTFRPPKTKAWAQKLRLKLNRYINLPFKRISIVVPPEERAKLRAIPKNAGNVVVGPHPGPKDSLVMFNLYHEANRLPSGFFWASEGLQNLSPIKRKVVSWVGAIPIARGKKNPEAIEYLTDKIANGGWGGIFPEGEVYFSRRVMPMEYGAVRIATDSAIKVQQEAKEKGIPESQWRPVFLTPFAHVYFHKPEVMKTKMAEALSDLEKQPAVFGVTQDGSLVKRLRAVAQRIMELKAEEYGIPKDAWDDPDIYNRVHKLRDIMLEQLEKKYFGNVSEGYERRRAMKARMAVYEQLKQPDLAPEQREELERDITKTRDVILATSFARDYKEKTNDIEMWGEYLKRFRSSMQLETMMYGPQTVKLKVLPSINMHQAAQKYQSLTQPDDQMQYLFEVTESVRQTIQSGVDAILKETPTAVLTE